MMINKMKNHPEIYLRGLAVSNEASDIIDEEADKLGIYNQLVADGEAEPLEE
jgi:hypothetical protein